MVFVLSVQPVHFAQEVLQLLCNALKALTVDLDHLQQLNVVQIVTLHQLAPLQFLNVCVMADTMEQMEFVLNAQLGTFVQLLQLLKQPVLKAHTVDLVPLPQLSVAQTVTLNHQVQLQFLNVCVMLDISEQMEFVLSVLQDRIALKVQLLKQSVQ